MSEMQDQSVRIQNAKREAQMLNTLHTRTPELRNHPAAYQFGELSVMMSVNVLDLARLRAGADNGQLAPLQKVVTAAVSRPDGTTTLEQHKMYSGNDEIDCRAYTLRQGRRPLLLEGFGQPINSGLDRTKEALTMANTLLGHGKVRDANAADPERNRQVIGEMLGSGHNFADVGTLLAAHEALSVAREG